MWIKLTKNKDFKRNIRFDDSELTFCIDMRFPNATEWVTVDYARALADRRDTFRAAVDVHGDLLSTRTSTTGEETNKQPEQGTGGQEPERMDLSTSGAAAPRNRWGARK